MTRTTENVIEIIRNHGLFCIALTDGGLIGLTDKDGNIYDVIIWDGENVLEDENKKLTLAAWLGY